MLWEAARQGVAIMSFHTALDATDAAGRMIPEMLSLEAGEVFEQKPGLTDNGVPAGYGRVCTPAENERLSVGLLASRCTAVFGIQPRVWGSFTDRLEHILTWGGSLGSAEDYAALCRMDAIVCGEVKYHLALDLSEAGVSVIELGHDVSELPLTLVLARSVRDCGIDQQHIMVLDRGPHWAYPETIRI